MWGAVPFGRRRLRQGAGLAGTAAALAACGVPGIRVTDYVAVTDVSDTDPRLSWSNWPFSVDVPEEGTDDPTTLEKFTQKTGIEVAYTET